MHGKHNEKWQLLDADGKAGFPLHKHTAGDVQKLRVLLEGTMGTVKWQEKKRLVPTSQRAEYATLRNLNSNNGSTYLRKT